MNQKANSVGALFSKTGGKSIVAITHVFCNLKDMLSCFFADRRMILQRPAYCSRRYRRSACDVINCYFFFIFHLAKGSEQINADFEKPISGNMVRYSL